MAKKEISGEKIVTTGRVMHVAMQLMIILLLIVFTIPLPFVTRDAHNTIPTAIK